MKKLVGIMLVVALVYSGIAIAKWNYDRTHYTAYVYTKGQSFDTGNIKGNEWNPTGETIDYCWDERVELVNDGVRVSWQGLNGINAIGFTLTKDTALLVPELGFDCGITDSYAVTF